MKCFILPSCWDPDPGSVWARTCYRSGKNGRIAADCEGFSLEGGHVEKQHSPSASHTPVCSHGGLSMESCQIDTYTRLSCSRTNTHICLYSSFISMYLPAAVPATFRCLGMMKVLSYSRLVQGESSINVDIRTCTDTHILLQACCLIMRIPDSPVLVWSLYRVESSGTKCFRNVERLHTHGPVDQCLGGEPATYWTVLSSFYYTLSFSLSFSSTLCCMWC